MESQRRPRRYRSKAPGVRPMAAAARRGRVVDGVVDADDASLSDAEGDADDASLVAPAWSASMVRTAVLSAYASMSLLLAPLPWRGGDADAMGGRSPPTGDAPAPCPASRVFLVGLAAAGGGLAARRSGAVAVRTKSSAKVPVPSSSTRALGVRTRELARTAAAVSGSATAAAAAAPAAAPPPPAAAAGAVRSACTMAGQPVRGHRAARRVDRPASYPACQGDLSNPSKCSSSAT